VPLITAPPGRLGQSAVLPLRRRNKLPVSGRPRLVKASCEPSSSPRGSNVCLYFVQRVVDLGQSLFDAQGRQPGRRVLVPAFLHELSHGRQGLRVVHRWSKLDHRKRLGYYYYYYYYLAFLNRTSPLYCQLIPFLGDFSCKDFLYDKTSISGSLHW